MIPAKLPKMWRVWGVPAIDPLSMICVEMGAVIWLKARAVNLPDKICDQLWEASFRCFTHGRVYNSGYRDGFRDAMASIAEALRTTEDQARQLIIRPPVGSDYRTVVWSSTPDA